MILIIRIIMLGSSLCFSLFMNYVIVDGILIGKSIASRRGNYVIGILAILVNVMTPILCTFLLATLRKRNALRDNVISRKIYIIFIVFFTAFAFSSAGIICGSKIIKVINGDPLKMAFLFFIAISSVIAIAVIYVYPVFEFINYCKNRLTSRWKGECDVGISRLRESDILLRIAFRIKAGDARKNITFARLVFPIALYVSGANRVGSATFPFSFMLDAFVGNYVAWLMMEVLLYAIPVMYFLGKLQDLARLTSGSNGKRLMIVLLFLASVISYATYWRLSDLQLNVVVNNWVNERGGKLVNFIKQERGKGFNFSRKFIVTYKVNDNEQNSVIIVGNWIFGYLSNDVIVVQ